MSNDLNFEDKLQSRTLLHLFWFFAYSLWLEIHKKYMIQMKIRNIAGPLTGGNYESRVFTGKIER